MKKNPYFHGWFKGATIVGTVVFGKTLNRVYWIADLKRRGFQVRDMGDYAEYGK